MFSNDFIKISAPEVYPTRGILDRVSASHSNYGDITYVQINRPRFTEHNTNSRSHTRKLYA